MVDERQEPPPGENEGHVHDVWTVPNVITLLRLLLIPFAFTVLISDRPDKDVVAFVLFAAAASTDWVDGQLARRTGRVSIIGKAIDPLVDRGLLAAGVFGLYMEQRLPLWILGVLILRDVWLLYGAWRLEQHHLRMPVTYLGKVTTALLMTGFSLLILQWPALQVSGRTLQLGLAFVYVGVVTSLLTAVQYTLKAHDMIADAG